MEILSQIGDGILDFLGALGLATRTFLTKARTNPPRNRRGKIRRMKLSKALHLILFAVVLVYNEIVLRALNGTGIFQNLIYPILFALAIGALLNIPTTLFPKSLNRKITLGLLIIIAVLYIAECLIYNSYQVYMTFGSIIAGAGGVMNGYSSDLIRGLVGGLFAMFLFFLPAALYFFFGKRKVPAFRYKPYFAGVMVVIFAVFFGIGTLSASTGKSKLKYTSQFNFNVATQTFGLPTSLRLNITHSGSSSDDTFQITTADNGSAGETAEAAGEEGTEAGETATDYGYNIMDLDFDSIISSNSDDSIVSVTQYIQSRSATNKNEYTGLFEGKNLIIIGAEALSDAAVSEKLTPTLYRLVHNGFYFSNYYQPNWGGSTSTGEYSLLLGLIPSFEVETMQNTIGRNNYFTLGNALQRENYYNAAFHNGDYTYYNRQETHPNLGYQTWLAVNNGLETLNGKKYAEDQALFEDTIDLVMETQPFSVYYMTGSGHAPYIADSIYVTENMDYVKANIDRTDYEDKSLYYLCYQVELEQALEVLVQKLEDAGIADDTVIALTADHEPYGLSKSSTWGNDKNYVPNLYGQTDEETATPWGLDHNVLVIWSGCLENEDKDMQCEITDPVSSVDIVPTLLNLFGIEYDSRLLAGRDAFSDSDPMVVWNTGSWMTSLGRYASGSATFTPNDGVTVSDDYVDNMCAEATNLITMSRVIRKQDYYSLFFGEDDTVGQRMTQFDQYITATE